MPLRLRATPQKYKARACVIQGHRFASQKEGARFLQLSALEKSGQIRNLVLQPRLDLLVPTADGPKKIGHMTLDFKYDVPLEHYYVIHIPQVETTCFGAKTVWEDVKSPATRTTAYRLRKKMVEAIYGIAVLET